MGNSYMVGQTGGGMSGRIFIGEYVGDGTNPKSITFPFTPRLVQFNTDVQNLTSIVYSPYRWGSAQFRSYRLHYNPAASGEIDNINVAIYGNTMTMSSTRNYMNENGWSYTYMAYE